MANNQSRAPLTRYVILALGFLGLFLRVYFWSVNRSLWLDEVMLALNITNRSFLDLLKPLDFHQGAPIVFLFAQKAVVTLLGHSDYVWRLIPLVAGLSSVPMMYGVSRRIGGTFSWGPVFALGLFALSPPLIYYSSELKQYSTDVWITLWLLWLVSECLRENPGPRPFFVLGIAGALAPWFSHPSVFVYAGILGTLGLMYALHKDVHRLGWLAEMGMGWAASVALLYAISLRHLRFDTALIGYWRWRNVFAPFPAAGQFAWYYNVLTDLLTNLATLPASFLLILLLMIGAFSLAFRKWPWVLIVGSPFLLALLASGLEIYPFHHRFLLFLLPFLFLLLAEGVERVRVILRKVNQPLAGMVFACLVVYGLYGPAVTAYAHLRSPPLGEDLKPVLAYVKEHARRSDILYIYPGADLPFRYYAPRYELDRADYRVGRPAHDHPASYLKEIGPLQGHARVWFVFSHNCTWGPVNEQAFIREHLDAVGRKKREMVSGGSAAFLYDLRPLP